MGKLKNLEQTILNEEEREEKFPEESFAKLSCGVTHYRIRGKQSSELIVLMHGAVSPYEIAWKNNSTALLNAGFRVLEYDHYGRGLSDRIATSHTTELFTNQLKNLLSYCKIDSPFYLVGLSMGGGLALHFMHKNPTKVKKLVLIAPWILMEEEKVPLIQKILTTQFIGSRLMTRFGDQFFLKQIPKQLKNNPELIPLIESKYREQQSYIGFKRGILSTLKEYPCKGIRSVLKDLTNTEKGKVCLIWGNKDKTAPYPIHKKVLKLAPWIQFEKIKNGDHLINLLKSKKVNKKIINFFNEK